MVIPGLTTGMTVELPPLPFRLMIFKPLMSDKSVNQSLFFYVHNSNVTYTDYFDHEVNPGRGYLPKCYS